MTCFECLHISATEKKKTKKNSCFPPTLSFRLQTTVHDNLHTEYECKPMQDRIKARGREATRGKILRDCSFGLQFLMGFPNSYKKIFSTPQVLFGKLIKWQKTGPHFVVSKKQVNVPTTLELLSFQ